MNKFRFKDFARRHFPLPVAKPKGRKKKKAFNKETDFVEGDQVIIHRSIRSRKPVLRKSPSSFPTEYTFKGYTTYGGTYFAQVVVNNSNRTFTRYYDPKYLNLAPGD